VEATTAFRFQPLITARILHPLFTPRAGDFSESGKNAIITDQADTSIFPTTRLKGALSRRS